MASGKGKGFVTLIPVKVNGEETFLGDFHLADSEAIPKKDREFIKSTNPKEEAVFITHFSLTGLSALTVEKFSSGAKILGKKIIVKTNDLTGATIKIA